VKSSVVSEGYLYYASIGDISVMLIAAVLTSL